MEYDFSKLNDREFEALGASVIGKILSKRIETFKAGKDGGVDGRFWIGKKREGIIQCKHYVETPYNSLISKLKSEEAAKVKKLNPEKYIFITSQKLSRHNKQEIQKIFHPYIKREDDIFGKEDLSDFLTKKENQDIVEQNLKLWITSASVLDLIHNNAIKGRSESTIREIEENAHKYAITENHIKGLKLLKEKNVVIMTGEPGIGKTTLADNLALFYIAKGYEFCDIEESISEAESIFREKEKKKILFYCDDFLGSNLYDAISNKKDSHIVKFINRVCRDNSKKIILTSRTNILNKAYSISHKFQNGKIRDNEFLLKVENLSKIDKAQILYNHIYHSNLNKEYIDVIYQYKNYNKIITHRNFNPRIIEFVTDNIRIGSVLPVNYWEYVKNSLDNPQDIWADYFQNQTDDCVRALIFLTVYNNGRISEEELRRSYNTFIKIHTVNLGDQTDKSFESVRKLAAKSLLNRNNISENSYEYVLFNPSIADFVLNTYCNEIELISNVLKSLETETSLRNLDTITIFNKINKQSSKKIQENLFEYFFERKIEEEDWDFLILLSYQDFFNENLNKQIEYFLKTLIEADNPKGNNLCELLSILTDFDPEIEFKDYKFLYNFIEDFLNEDELIDLLNFIDKFDINDKNILSQVENHTELYLEDIIKNNDLDIDFSNYISVNSFPDYDLDISGVESEISSILDSSLEYFNKNVLEKIEFSTSNIISSLDIDDMAISYLETQDYEYDRDMGGSYNSGTSNQDDIDAIFER
ncbi:nSTAND3 domain-containing NTPase [Winogradskyella bathintestinalis]|uniref:Restriction endonuclease n=1 Tax=Winogradskyella bathintestinalis TaxID=3035208 RepID=A0ABT7ZZ56_9FLAO|nr:restriction endonuclease [Winogradskyella bathintestinalis]MDN3494267.1 restriction endonuclease [Winogradskyella bathintestinalis]